MNWRQYLGALLVFNAAGFVTNANWQAYSGEVSVSNVSPMAGLAVHNFLSPATGMATMLTLICAIRERPHTSMGDLVRRYSARLRYREQPPPPVKAEAAATALRDFRVDCTRTILYLLLPLSLLLAVALAGQGVVQSFAPPATATTLEGGRQLLPLGPAALQIAVK